MKVHVQVFLAIITLFGTIQQIHALESNLTKIIATKCLEVVKNHQGKLTLTAIGAVASYILYKAVNGNKDEFKQLMPYIGHGLVGLYLFSKIRPDKLVHYMLDKFVKVLKNNLTSQESLIIKVNLLVVKYCLTMYCALLSGVFTSLIINKYTREALQKAISENNFNKCLLLILLGTNVNDTNTITRNFNFQPNHLNPLLAITVGERPIETTLRLNNDAKIASLFLNHPLCITEDSPVFNLDSLLFDAVTQNKKIDSIDTLIDNGANINAITNDQTPLIFATINYGIESLDFLIRRGAIVDYRDTQGRTPLMHAAITNNPTNAKFLINRMADINKQDFNGKTTIMHAAINNNLEIVRYFILNHLSDLNLALKDMSDKAFNDYINDKPEILNFINDHKAQIREALYQEPLEYPLVLGNVISEYTV